MTTKIAQFNPKNKILVPCKIGDANTDEDFRLKEIFGILISQNFADIFAPFSYILVLGHFADI